MSKNKSYQRSLRLLKRFCSPPLYESIEGDLLEQFTSDLEHSNEQVASRKLFWNVIKFCRPGIILRNRFSYTLIDTVMLTNYLIIAYRNLTRHKVFSFINIVGLAIGLTACLLILQTTIYP